MNVSNGNIFGRFFYSQGYIEMKNYLYNYKLRKRAIRKAFLKALTKNHSSNYLILDIGSGISPVSPDYKRTIFIDLEKQAIDILKKQGLKAETGSITKIPYPSGKFDFIVCSEVLEHVKDYKKALKEMKRVLKPEGFVIITVPTFMHYWKLDDELVGHLRRFNPDNLKKDLIQSNLIPIYEKHIGSPLERWITYLLVKLSLNSKKPPRLNKFLLQIFNIINEFIFIIISLASLFNTKESSSIFLVMAKAKS